MRACAQRTYAGARWARACSTAPGSCVRVRGVVFAVVAVMAAAAAAAAATTTTINNNNKRLRRPRCSCANTTLLQPVVQSEVAQCLQNASCMGVREKFDHPYFIGYCNHSSAVRMPTLYAEGCVSMSSCSGGWLSSRRARIKKGRALRKNKDGL